MPTVNITLLEINPILVHGEGGGRRQLTLTEINPEVIFTPILTTDAGIRLATSAILNGTLENDGGQPCDCGFEWGETDAYGNTTPTQSRTTGQTFTQTITELDPGKTYHFRAFATNDAGTSEGADKILPPPGMAGLNPALLELL